jgi:hypothetical protein
MIRAQKHLKLDVCVLRIAALMLAHLRRKRIEAFASLHDLVVNELGGDAAIQFQPALNLLYLLGKVQYHEHHDRIEYIGT